MNRRTLLATVGTAITSAGCLSSITDEERQELQYLEISHQGEEPQTYHLLVRADDELDYWSSVDIEPRSVRRICGDWSADGQSYELFVRSDDRSDWESQTLQEDLTCFGIYYDDYRGLGFTESSCAGSCSDDSGPDADVPAAETNEDTEASEAADDGADDRSNET